MEPPNPNPPSPMRVLIRPPLPPPPNLPHPTPATPTPPRNGVVVVGFIGKRFTDVSSLLNRIIDCNVFGSGNLDKPLFTFGEKLEFSDEISSWFKSRKISFYHDEDKGILYLQFSSSECPVMEDFPSPEVGLDSVLEDYEFGDLQGMLFMFSVCHVIVFIQEGSRFDPQILKKFRILQAAKHAMGPFVRSRASSPGPSSSHIPSRTSALGMPSNNPSPGRSRGILSRNASAVTLMSGLGSYSSLLPGQCSPVMLFVFLDEFSDPISTASPEEPAESSSLNQSSNPNNMTRSNVPTKGSGPVVMLARPVNKSEGSFRKKLQSSLEGQIRFSIKKCRTLSGSETSHSGSRTAGVSSPAPLFSLDASKAVALVDISLNQRGESLAFVTGLVENILNGKATSDCLLLESHGQRGSKEDMLSVKEFIFRQCDILRGKGGLSSNTNSGSTAGVGMVAVAAAAAAASAASGKTLPTPDLPNYVMWLSSSQKILHQILTAKYTSEDQTITGRELPNQRSSVSPSLDRDESKYSLDAAISCLENSRGLISKFSTLWCEKALPVAKEVYTRELPHCYSTSQHEAHLDKALRVFSSMVKGPAVHSYIKRLEEECTSIWTSGRQLCDAVSLTGRPCIHQRHDLPNDESKPHSSGYVFLHACACGRLRQLRPDPFDFETANLTSSFFPKCDKHLPALQFPQGCLDGPIQPSSWSLIRVGGARYYEPSKGLLQSGFCASRRFLFKCTILLEKQKNFNDFSCNGLEGNSSIRVSGNTKDVSVADAGVKKTIAALGEMHNGVQIQKRASTENLKADDKLISFGRGASNFGMKKPFSEVVAGSGTTDSRFPPLQSRKQSVPNTEKVIKQDNRGRGDDKVNEHSGSRDSEKIGENSAVHGNKIGISGFPHTKPVLQTGSSVVPVNACDGEKTKDATSLKHVTLYIGFEHECPHGHRFILSPDQLSVLDSSNAMPAESLGPLSLDKEHKAEDLTKAKGHGKVHRQPNGKIGSPMNNRSLEKLRERARSGIVLENTQAQSSGQATEQNCAKALDDSTKDLGTNLQSITLDDGGVAFSMLNRDLPIYMSCPYCKDLKHKKNSTNVKFAGCISQLQRIFLVTPPFPVTLATCPVIQFNASCLPASLLDCEKKLQFSVGCKVILPPESFLSLRLPFVYGVELDGRLHPLKPLEHQPETTAWIHNGTTLQIVSKGDNIGE